VTGRVLLRTSWKTGTVTLTVGGSIETGATAASAASIAIGVMSWSMLMPDGWTVTSARTATIVSTIDLGPDTTTVAGSIVGAPVLRPGGRGAMATSTRNSRWAIVSSSTVTRSGVKPMTWMSDPSAATTRTGTDTAPVPAGTLARSTVAVNVLATGRRPDGEK
jgi:hypothetical protein